MINKNKLNLILLFLVFILIGFILRLNAQTISHAPVVTNIRIEQKAETKTLNIFYDVNDEDADLLEVSLIASKDGGKTFTVIPKSVSGEIGKIIFPGKAKKIVWNAGVDLPEVDLKNLKIRIIADDGVRIVTGQEKETRRPLEASYTKPTEVPTTTPKIQDDKPPKDGSAMVLIPAGEFQMGSNDGDPDERPVHTVYLDAFYIDVYEVTNAQYRKFVEATGREKPFLWKFPHYSEPDQPVVSVTWEDANAYAKWVGKRLPTEAEWEKAARGGLTGKKYYWGDDTNPPQGTGNFADISAKEAFPNWNVIPGYKDGFSHIAPVGCFSKNGYGLYDIGGNVWEWCSDWYDPNYYSKSPRENPKGPASGQDRVLRGGSWFLDNGSTRISNRYDYSASYSINFSSRIGFRCAKDAK